ncbi:MAG: histidine phosphatase family protein [Holosporales bacterium]|nr:histidine phosphatase family protein [Holosporales bacterium]
MKKNFFLKTILSVLLLVCFNCQGALRESFACLPHLLSPISRSSSQDGPLSPFSSKCRQPVRKIFDSRGRGAEQEGDSPETIERARQRQDALMGSLRKFGLDRSDLAHLHQVLEASNGADPFILRVLCIRHAPTEFNGRGIVQGRGTSSGVDATKTAEFMDIFGRKILPLFIDGHMPDRVFIATSPQQRCKDTASLLKNAPGFREREVSLVVAFPLDDIRGEGLVGRSTKDPEVVEMLQCFAQAPLKFMRERESGLLYAMSFFKVIRSVCDIYSNTPGSFDGPSDSGVRKELAIMVTHQTLLKIANAAVCSGAIDGVAVVAECGNDAFILEVDNRTFRPFSGSLDCLLEAVEPATTRE